jgi:hypothetical protein
MKEAEEVKTRLICWLDLALKNALCSVAMATTTLTTDVRNGGQ